MQHFVYDKVPTIYNEESSTSNLELIMVLFWLIIVTIIINLIKLINKPI